jgi:hypothetical protein
MKLSLRFKAGRDYVQGPDLFDAVESAVRHGIDPSAWITRARMSAMARGPVRIEVGTHADGLGQFDCRLDEGAVTVSLFDDPEGSPLEREPYDEGAVVERAMFLPGRTSFEGVIPRSVMEVATSLLKEQHNRDQPLDSGRWIWVGATLAAPVPSRFSRVETVVKRRLGSRLTQSTLAVDGKEIGLVHFAVSGA